MKTQSLFAIGIPTINRVDLLEETLFKYQKDFPNTDIFIVDNGHQHFIHRSEYKENIHFINNMENLGVSGSWNQLCETIFQDGQAYKRAIPEHAFAIIVNDDIYWGKNEAQVKEFIESNLMDGKNAFCTTTGTWCNFILGAATYYEVGPFDEVFFPAYFEDNDYEYRLKLAKKEVKRSEFMNAEIYRNSQTIEKDRSLNNNFENNRQYFIQKWGGAPEQETFLTEFNQ